MIVVVIIKKIKIYIIYFCYIVGVIEIDNIFFLQIEIDKHG